MAMFREDNVILFQVCMFQPASNADEIVLKDRTERQESTVLQSEIFWEGFSELS